MTTKDKQIHMLFVIESLQCGGAEKSITTLLQNIDLDKYGVDLILMTKGGEFGKFVPEKVNVIYKNQFEGNNPISNLANRLRFFFLRRSKWVKNHHVAQLYWKAFGKAIKKYRTRYDIAIAYNQGFSTYYVANKITSKKKFAWLNTDYQKAGYNINFDINHYKKYDKVVCVSKENEDSLTEALGSIHKEIPTTIIKDITDQDLISKMSTENINLSNDNQNKTIIVTVGRLAKAKGLEMAIEACSILKNQGETIQWYVIGEGPQRSRLEELIERKNLQETFCLLGFKENPYPYIKWCDIYVQTSIFEGLGLTVIEASVLQKPIVTTNFPTASSIIEHKKTGLICKMNAEDIAKSISYYIKNPQFMEEVSKQKPQRVNKDKEISLEQFENLITN